jgi:hypothetical protein
MINKILLSIFMITSSYGCFSQQISKSVIGVAGGNFVSDANTLTYNIGESVIGTMTSDSIQLGSGYLPSLDVSALSVQDMSLDKEIEIYPNPTTHSLNIKNEKMLPLDITVLDVHGKNILKSTSHENLLIDVSGYKNGSYFLLIKNQHTNTTNSYQFIKN